MLKSEILLNNQIFKTCTLLERTGNSIFQKFGLTVKTYKILFCIQNGITKSTDIADNISGSLSSIAQKTKILENKGFIVRKIDSNDKRIWYFSLTPKGGKILESILPNYEKAICKLYEFLNKNKIEEIYNILQTIEKRLNYANGAKLVSKIIK